MKDTVDILVEHYGLRLTLPELAKVLKRSPGKLRAQISAATFPIRIYKESEARSAPWFADARDVAEYLDRLRPKTDQKAA